MPELTQGEQAVVRTLCRLVRDRDDGDPPRLQEIADQLFVGKAAVIRHLINICQKFGVPTNDRRTLVQAIVDGGWCDPDGGVGVA
jgi:hypothetical protein